MLAYIPKQEYIPLEKWESYLNFTVENITVTVLLKPDEWSSKQNRSAQGHGGMKD